MAFTNTHPAQLSGPAGGSASRFDALERHVLLLARKDRAWSLRGRGAIDRLLRGLFGVAPANTLADPRLEALRRLAVAARLGRIGAIRREATAFLSRGFTPVQRDAVLGLEWAR
jgi:hypothetical protein